MRNKMAKKTAAKTTDDELEDEIFGVDEEVKDDAPDSEPSADPESSEPSTEEVSQEIADLLARQLELKEEVRDYKYLKLVLEEASEDKFLVTVKSQSHGLMNYLVSKVLKIKGVLFSAYKNTSLEEPKIIIHTDGSKDINAILKEASKLMRIELKGVGNAIASLKI
jgi:DNA-directed RNA polymerase subunit L